MFQSDRLAVLRKGKKIRQADMALHFGLERSTYGKYEQGSITPPGDMIAKLAIFFEVSSDYLLGLSDNPNPSSPMSESHNADDGATAGGLPENKELSGLPESEDINEFIEGYVKLDKKGKYYVMSEFYRQLERCAAETYGMAELAQGRKLPLTRKEAMRRESKSDE